MRKKRRACGAGQSKGQAWKTERKGRPYGKLRKGGAKGSLEAVEEAGAEEEEDARRGRAPGKGTASPFKHAAAWVSFPRCVLLI